MVIQLKTHLLFEAGFDISRSFERRRPDFLINFTYAIDPFAALKCELLHGQTLHVLRSVKPRQVLLQLGVKYEYRAVGAVCDKQRVL